VANDVVAFGFIGFGIAPRLDGQHGRAEGRIWKCAPTAQVYRSGMPRKQVYKITYPNGKIYVGSDVLGIGNLTYFGSPSAAAKARIAAENEAHRLDFEVRKQILWESDSATDVEVRAMEIKLIRESNANDPAVGYNLTPRWSG
jgi:hypothetical protein